MKTPVVKMLGKTFGSVTVLRRDGSDRHGRATWECKCDCGREFITDGSALRSGKRKSCGACKKHKLSETPTYTSWRNARSHCTTGRAKDHGSKAAKRSMCRRWDLFVNFLEDMGERPPGHQLMLNAGEREYRLGTCAWVPIVQAHKAMPNIRYLPDGTPLADAARQFGIKPKTLASRLDSGWKLEVALTSPVRQRTYVPKDGTPPTFAIDMTGKRVGCLKVERRGGCDKKRRALWICSCTCGGTREVSGDALRKGRVAACLRCSRAVTESRKKTKTQQLVAAARALGQSPVVVMARIKAGWPRDKALTVPIEGLPSF